MGELDGLFVLGQQANYLRECKLSFYPEVHKILDGLDTKNLFRKQQFLEGNLGCCMNNGGVGFSF